MPPTTNTLQPPTTVPPSKRPNQSTTTTIPSPTKSLNPSIARLATALATVESLQSERTRLLASQQSARALQTEYRTHLSEIKATKKNQASAYELEFALAGLKKELQDGATRWEEIEEGIEEAWAEITVDGRAGQWRVGGRVAGRVIVGEEMHAIPEGGKSEGL